MEYPWYEIVDTEQLEQGDFLGNCPLLDPPLDLKGPLAADAELGGVALGFLDAVVLTQSCDLVANKVNRVLLCPVVPCASTVANLSSKDANAAFEQLEKHLVFKRHLLERCQLDGHSHPHRIALFEDVFSLPIDYVRAVLIGAQKLRLRLLPPYREHLAQRYGTFVTRIGNPTDMTKIPRL